MSHDWKRFPQVTTAEIKRANEQLLFALSHHSNKQASLYLRSVALNMATQQSANSAEYFNRRNVAGALLLAAETLLSSDAAWNAARDNEYGRLERASFHIKEGNP